MKPERAGRDGFLRLRFERRGARTVLAQSRFSLPLQALTPLAPGDGDDGACWLMLLNPTGGVLGGDRLVTEITLEAGTHVCLTTPSATRIYRSAAEPAILETVVHVGEGAVLEYMPDQVIPHAGSVTRQSLWIEMERVSRAIVLDSMACGRLAHGERWAFEEMDSRMEIQICGSPVYRNRTKIVPAVTPPDKLGLMESFGYIANVGIFADDFARWDDLFAAIHRELDNARGISGGASLISRGGCIARFLAGSAPDMTLATKKLWDAARAHLAGLPPFEPRKY